MNLEALPKYYSPKSPKLSDDAPATGSGGLTITDVMAAQGHHLSVRSHPYQSAKSPEYQAFRRFTVRHGSRQIVDSRTP